MQGFMQLFNSELCSYMLVGIILIMSAIMVVIAVERTYYTLCQYFLEDKLKAQIQVLRDIIIELKKMQ